MSLVSQWPPVAKHENCATSSTISRWTTTWRNPTRASRPISLPWWLKTGNPSPIIITTPRFSGFISIESDYSRGCSPLLRLQVAVCLQARLWWECARLLPELSVLPLLLALLAPRATDTMENEAHQRALQNTIVQFLKGIKDQVYHQVWGWPFTLQVMSQILSIKWIQKNMMEGSVHHILGAQYPVDCTNWQADLSILHLGEHSQLWCHKWVDFRFCRCSGHLLPRGTLLCSTCPSPAASLRHASSFSWALLRQYASSWRRTLLLTSSRPCSARILSDRLTPRPARGRGGGGERGMSCWTEYLYLYPTVTMTLTTRNYTYSYQ